MAMSPKKIAEELEKRDAVLACRETELRSKFKECRFHEPFAHLTDEEIDGDPEMYRRLSRLEQPFQDKLYAVAAERRCIRCMLREYREYRP